jgi:hypothetical protein
MSGIFLRSQLVFSFEKGDRYFDRLEDLGDRNVQVVI